jgi:DNA-binding transcriptional LysR family regulator
MFAAHAIRPNVALVTNVSLTLCEFVASGAGVSLDHPVMASGFRDRVVARRFEPATYSGFLLCHGREGRNARLVESFLDVARAAARRVLAEALEETPQPRGAA